MSTKVVFSSLAVVLLALLACKHSGPQPQTALDQPPAPADAAVVDAGEADTASAAPTDTITLECDGDAGTCYDQAKSRCANGYDEVEKHEDTVAPPQARAGKPAADLFKPKTPPPVATTHTRLVVRCRGVADAAVP